MKCLELDYGKAIETATVTELYNAVSKAAMLNLRRSEKPLTEKKRACYFSAEFLIGRLIYSNLFNLGLLEETTEFLKDHGIDISVFEDIEDNALGNGGLGRLAACFLDSAATQKIGLDGYGIRYKYGIFKQYFENGCQKELPDDWTRFGDPWSIRREDMAVTVEFSDCRVLAVPYDTPVVGYENGIVNNLRLYQAEPLQRLDFEQFNKQDYSKAFEEKNNAEAISAILYPNDDTDKGKLLRIKQQYFFVSAALQNILSDFKEKYGNHFKKLPDYFAVQLNDTHPIVAVPELIRLLSLEGVGFRSAFSIASKVFAYTNHTVMAEALEKWSVRLYKSVLPEIYKIIMMIDKKLMRELKTKGITGEKAMPYKIICDKQIHMARLAVYSTFSTNGVARLHTEILKESTISQWHELYPDRINNKTNGITQRRWLALSNPGLSAFITDKIGNGWLTDLDELKKLEQFKNDKTFISEFEKIKHENKIRLCDFIEKQESVKLNPDFIFDMQIKRLHEYKRQLLNVLSIIDIYFSLKDGTLKGFNPTAFIFGAKSAPGYYRAKSVIKLINTIAERVNSDIDVNDKLAVLFVSNYNVSYAEKLIPACDISEQISTAGTEASGTGNMKFMLNGAVTLGTYDGANIEIVEQSGEENNYIFGARVENIKAVSESYDPTEIYEKSPRIKRVVDSLTDGTFDDGGTGMFKELYNSLMTKTWNKPDNYYILLDFEDYMKTKLKSNADYSDRFEFTKKCFLNTCNAGKFSSDRTIKEYASEIWFKK
jgi:starch phosphorylase